VGLAERYDGGKRGNFSLGCHGGLISFGGSGQIRWRGFAPLFMGCFQSTGSGA
jgi:hypothetical protein